MESKLHISRKVLFGKLNLSLFRALESAAAYAKLKSHFHVDFLTWLWHFWQLQNTDIHCLAAHHRLYIPQIDLSLRQACQRLAIHPQGLSNFSPIVIRITEMAWFQASLVHGDNKIRSAWLLSAMLADDEIRATLRSVVPELLKISVPVDHEGWVELLRGPLEQKEGPHDGSGLPSAVPGEASQAMSIAEGQGGALRCYCTDLTEDARAGRIDAVIGRGHEINSMIDILSRRQQNNPLLTGEAGVGKTAVVEGLALAIARQHVPPNLQNVRLMSLDVGALLAGASMRGEFEARFKQLLTEVQSADQPIILFIDEVHTLVGAGGQAGTGDAANLLKPALARGGLRTIGATTWAEYKKHIEKDPALTRPFQVLQIHEPEIINAMAMVRSLVDVFAKHHGVVIDNAAVETAVTLSHRYIPARQLPDKAVSLLDTACARVAMSQHSLPSELVECKAQIEVLQTRLQLCQREQERTRNVNPELQAMVLQLQQLEAREAVIVERWNAETNLVQQLKRQWQQEQAQVSGSGSGVFESSAEQLMAQLQNMQTKKPLVYAVVNAAVIASVVSDWTGVPVGKILVDDAQAALQLQTHLTHRVKGPHHAVQAIAQRVQISKAGLTDPNKPVGVFMLVRPSGVGKTETALALADAVT